jgi:hypothetical protein
VQEHGIDHSELDWFDLIIPNIKSQYNLLRPQLYVSQVPTLSTPRAKQSNSRAIKTEFIARLQDIRIITRSKDLLTIPLRLILQYNHVSNVHCNNKVMS